MLCNCAMGLMPEIKRAWLTIDSTIYMWNYEDGKDLAYFDGLSEVILAAGLVVPKPGVFQSHIRYLLCLTTAVEIVVLGVSFTGVCVCVCVCVCVHVCACHMLACASQCILRSKHIKKSIDPHFTT